MANSRFGPAAWWLGTLFSQGGKDVGIQHVVQVDSADNEVFTAPTVPAAWATGATPQDARSYGSALLQVSGLTGGDTIAVTGSVDGTNYATLTGIGADHTTPSPITADGIYAFGGGMYLKWTKTGSAGTPTVTLRLGQ